MPWSKYGSHWAHLHYTHKTQNFCGHHLTISKEKCRNFVQNFIYTYKQKSMALTTLTSMK